jgi:hypothetical protein
MTFVNQKCRWRCGTSSAMWRRWCAMRAARSGSAWSGHTAGRRRCSSPRRAMLWRLRCSMQLRSGRPASAARSRTAQMALLGPHSGHDVERSLLQQASTAAVACLQVAAGRPIAVLPCPSPTGSVIRSGDSGGSPAPVTIQVLQSSNESKNEFTLSPVEHPLCTSPPSDLCTEGLSVRSIERCIPGKHGNVRHVSREAHAWVTGSRAGAHRPVSAGCSGA